MRKNRYFRVEFYGCKVRFLYLFSEFYLLPTISTDTLNTYCMHGKTREDYAFTRYVSFLWLWFRICICWDYDLKL